MRIRKKKESKRRASKSSKQVFLRIKNNSYQFFLVAQELQHEFKKFFKISYVDETLNIRGFQRQVTDEKLEELLSTLSKRLEENKITLKGLSLNLRKFRLLTDAGIESIISRFGTTFKNLESLDLDFNMYICFIFNFYFWFSGGAETKFQKKLWPNLSTTLVNFKISSISASVLMLTIMKKAISLNKLLTLFPTSKVSELSTSTLLCKFLLTISIY